MLYVFFLVPGFVYKWRYHLKNVRVVFSTKNRERPFLRATLCHWFKPKPDCTNDGLVQTNDRAASGRICCVMDVSPPPGGPRHDALPRCNHLQRVNPVRSKSFHTLTSLNADTKKTRKPDTEFNIGQERDPKLNANCLLRPFFPFWLDSTSFSWYTVPVDVR